MHARGIPGLFAPRPFRLLDEERRSELLSNAISEELKRTTHCALRNDSGHTDSGHSTVSTTNGPLGSAKRSIQSNHQEL